MSDPNLQIQQQDYTTTTTTTTTTTSNTTSSTTHYSNSIPLLSRNHRSNSIIDPYRGRKKRRANSLPRASSPTNTTTIVETNNIHLVDNTARFQESDVIIQNLFKKNGDSELFFSAEVNKVNQVMKFQKRILIISDKFMYNMHPRTFQVKRAVPLDKIEKVHVSELKDHFLFIHVNGERDYMYHTERKTEVIQVLKLAKREKIPINERQSSWYSEGELEIQVSNTFQYAPFKHGDLFPVEFGYDEFLECQEQVIDFVKGERLNIRLMKDHNRLFSIDAIILEIIDSPLSQVAAAAADKRQSVHYLSSHSDQLEGTDEDSAAAAAAVEQSRRIIDVTDDPGTIQFSSKNCSYQLTVKFRIYKPLENVTVSHKVQATGAKKKKHVKNIGNVQLYSSELGRERFKYFEVKMDPVQVVSGLSATKVSVKIQDRDHKDPPLFKTSFNYTIGKKRFGLF